MLLGQVEQIGPWGWAAHVTIPQPQFGPQPRAFWSRCYLLFVALPQETPSLLLLREAHGPPPALLFSCQTGVGRTNLGMVLGTLILLHHSGTASRPE